jgi:hypothetical protein
MDSINYTITGLIVLSCLLSVFLYFSRQALATERDRLKETRTNEKALIAETESQKKTLEMYGENFLVFLIHGYSLGAKTPIYIKVRLEQRDAEWFINPNGMILEQLKTDIKMREVPIFPIDKIKLINYTLYYIDERRLYLIDTGGQVMPTR